MTDPLATLERMAAENSFFGIQTRPYSERLEGVRRGWWLDLEKLFREWWSFQRLTITRKKNELGISFPTNNAFILIRGVPQKFVVWVNNNPRQFDANANLYSDVLLWVDEVLRNKGVGV